MPFTLPFNKFNLNEIDIRTQYEQKKGVKLDNSSWFGWPTFLGGADTLSRQKQITFLEQIHFICSPFLKPFEEIQTASLYEQNLHLRALLLFITACHFTQLQLKGQSVLHRLINEYLGIHAHNFIDENELHHFSLLTLELINDMTLDRINKKFDAMSLQKIDSKQWSDFKQFLTANATLPSQNDYFMTNLLADAIGKMGYTLGFGLGFGIGTLVSNPTFLIPSYLYLVAVLNKVTQGGRVAALFIPGISATLIQSCIAASCAQTAAYVFNAIGARTGALIGMPMDFATQTAKIAFYKALHALNASHPTLDGFRLQDAKFFEKETETYSFEIEPLGFLQLLLIQNPTQQALLENPYEAEEGASLTI